MSGFYGPALPPGFSVSQGDDNEAEKEHAATTTSLQHGPQLPGSEAETPAAQTSSVYGPVLPPPTSGSGADTVASTYGPSPPESDATRANKGERPTALTRKDGNMCSNGAV